LARNRRHSQPPQIGPIALAALTGRCSPHIAQRSTRRGLHDQHNGIAVVA
jgi:hypothetical protein